MTKSCEKAQVAFDEKATKAQIFSALQTIIFPADCCSRIGGIDFSLLGDDPEFAGAGRHPREDRVP